MEKAKKVKIFLGSAYILILVTFLWFIFSHFSISDFSSFDIIKENRNNLNKVKNNNFFLSSFLFLILCIVWTILLGFATPIILIGGFIFGKWIGTFLLVFGFTLGSSLLYLFADFFFKEIIKEKFQSRFSNFTDFFKKNEFLYFFLYRLVGGIPFAIQNLLPTLFNIKLKNYFFGTFFGLTPQLFIGSSLGAGLNSIINESQEAPKFFETLKNPEIYMPILGLLIVFIITFALRKKLFKF
tara:strand:- start:244 stop:963 length:720 start_codon:yes stop_codon:yes gene_type:complete